MAYGPRILVHSYHDIYPIIQTWRLILRQLATLGLIALGLVAGTVSGQQNDVKVTSQQLTDSVYMLVGQGGNLGASIGEDGIFLIDDQYAPLTEKIRGALKEISPQPIRFVLNTHYHGDHTGGNENLGKTGTLIVAHDNVRHRMTVENFLELFDRRVPPAAPGALPVVTFSDTISFHLNGEDVKAIHVPPAHTDGDAFVHFPKANVLHMGDLYFNGMYPFIDIWSGGSVNGYIDAVHQALALIDDQTQVIPGHGPLSNKQEMSAFVAMIEASRDAVAKHVAAGHSLEDTVAAAPTADFDGTWGTGFIKADSWVKILYTDLSKN